MVGSTFQVPAIPLAAPPSGEADPVAPALGSTALEGDPASVVAVAAATGGVVPSDTGAGPAGRKNRYHRPAAPAMATPRTTTPMTTIAPRVLVGRAEVMGSAPRLVSMRSPCNGPAVRVA